MQQHHRGPLQPATRTDLSPEHMKIGQANRREHDDA
jgi:hypothetical protein